MRRAHLGVLCGVLAALVLGALLTVGIFRWEESGQPAGWVGVFPGFQGEKDPRTGMDVVAKPWPVWAVTFSPDGRWLAAGRGYHSQTKSWLGGKGEVNVWQVQDWSPRGGFSAPFTTYVDALAFTPDGKHLIAAATKYIQTDPRTGGPVVGTPNPYDGNVVYSWTVPDGTLEKTYRFNDFRDVPNRGAGSPCFLDVHPDGELIGLARVGAASVVLEWKTGRIVYDVMNNGYWQNLAFSPDGKNLVSALQSSVQLYDAATGKKMAAIEPTLANPAQTRWGEHGYELVGDRLICVCYCADGKHLAVGISDGSVRLLTADLTKELRSLQVSGEKEWVNAVASAPGTDLLAAATSSGVRLFETSSGKRVREWGKTDLRAFTVGLSPDGKLLAAGYAGKPNTEGAWRGGTINIWDTASGRLVKRLD